jgi:arginine:pyruvate transaminase
MRYASITDRLSGLGAEKWHVHFRALEKKRRGEEVLFLSIGEPDFEAPAAVIDTAVRQLKAGRTRYSNGRGERPVLEAVARKYARRTVRDVSPDQVLFLPGTQTALYASMMTLAEAGDEVLVPEPYYVTYDGVIAATGATLVPVRLDPADHFHLTPAALERAITPRSRVLLLNSPSNPTGAVLTRSEIEAIGAICRRHDLWIVSDEVYADLVFDGHAFASPFDSPELAERTVVVSSVSKSHAMTGYRAGWAIGPQAFTERLQGIAEVMLFGSPPFIQDATAYALDNDFVEVHQMREASQRRARLIVDALANQPGISCRMPEGGMFVFTDVRRSGLTGEAFALELLDDEGVAVMPGEVFGPSGHGHIRIGLTIDDQVLEEALGRIVRFTGRLARHRSRSSPGD